MNFKIYVGGQFVATDNELKVFNSFDNQLIASTYIASPVVLNDAIIAAESAKPKMREMPVFRRYSILMQIAKNLAEDRQSFAEILALEACKPIKYALGEIDRAVQTFTVAAEETKRIPAEYFSVDWTPAGIGKEGFVKYFPVGLVAGIAPFNFPLNLAVHKIAPAIASGNCIIIKPSRSTPLSVLKLASIIDKTELPKGAISILPMDRTSGNLLVTDKRFAKLSFTGSLSVGWQMKQDCGRKKITLELGGNAGVIVSNTADIDFAVDRCVIGAFAYSGQVCIHTQRIYIHESKFDEFTAKFCAVTEKLVSGHPLDNKADISSMIDEANAMRVEHWVDEAVEQGAKILHGGKRIGALYQPTVLTKTNANMRVCSDEVFGPVVVLEKYSNYSNVVDEINNTDFGLQSSVFTNSISEMNYAYEHVDVGGLIINEIPTFRVDHMPYGGVKNSGFGREGIKYAIMEMMEPKLLIKNT